MGRHPVEDHADAVPVHDVDEGPEVVRRAERRLRCVVPGHLVAPGALERMLHDRHQLDVREAQVAHVRAELLGELAPAEAATPGRRVHLVHRDGALERILLPASLDPLGVLPDVVRLEDHRRGLRRHLGAKRVRVRLVSAVEMELVAVALLRALDDALPDAGLAEEAQRARGRIPAVEVPDDADERRVRRPDGEADALRDDVRAELLVDLLVAPGPRQPDIDVAEAPFRQPGTSSSSMRTMPATGMPIQSGRLFSS